MWLSLTLRDGKVLVVRKMIILREIVIVSGRGGPTARPLVATIARSWVTDAPKEPKRVTYLHLPMMDDASEGDRLACWRTRPTLEATLAREKSP